MQTNQLQSY